MYILGLHGGSPRTHDASACLIKDGKIIAFAEEERFTRQKRAFDKSPINASLYCMGKAKINISDVDIVAIGPSRDEKSKLDIKQYINDLLPKNIFQGNHNYKFQVFSHHLCHAASTFYCSGFVNSAILVVDGEGSGLATSIYFGSPNGIDKIKSFPVNQSLGYLYSSFSRFFGFGSFGAGKLMGLSSYGSPIYIDKVDKIFKKIGGTYNKKREDSQKWYSAICLPLIKSMGFPAPRNRIYFDMISTSYFNQPILTRVHKDLAASVQRYLEQKLLWLAQRSIDLTKNNNLCMSGGVALNCVANSKIEKSLNLDGFFVQPACEDSGISLGAALLSSGKPVKYYGPSLGISYSNQAIGKIIKKLGLKATRIDNPAQVGASLIAQNKIIGWFQGRMETGPRALGSRSILADPRKLLMKDLVNDCKNREKWRPFGPSVIDKDAADVFVSYKNSPYMLKSFDIKKRWIKKIPAVVHVDGTSRPQVVTRKYNALYYELLNEFKKISGIPMVLNTSFNYAGEPIVCSPIDAIKTFYSTSLDALVIGNFLLIKERR